MNKHNADNERVKRKYLTYLKNAKGKSEATLDNVAQALGRFEDYTRHKDFKVFHLEQAVGFKRKLAEERVGQGYKKLSIATQHGTLLQLRAFFHWLAREPGYKSRISFSDADYFNMSDKEVRTATAHREAPKPTPEQIRHVIERMPTETEIDRRNRALVAFIFVTGARDGAVPSFKMKHLKMADRTLEQDAREVKTKGSKTFTTWFFPVGEEFVEILKDWVIYLRQTKLWGDDDPIFPATEMGLDGDNRFEVKGIARTHWSGAGTIRKVFKEAFESASLPYFRPHSFRRTLVLLGQTLCATPEQYKAWSQNLGHDDVLTTFQSYGTVSRARQNEIMRELAEPKRKPESHVDELAEMLLKRMREVRVDGG